MDIRKMYSNWLANELKTRKLNNIKAEQLESTITQEKIDDSTVLLIFDFLSACIETELDEAPFSYGIEIYVKAESKGYRIFTDYQNPNIQDISCFCTEEIDIPCCIQGIIDSFLKE